MDDGLVVRAPDGDEAAFAAIAIEVAPRFHAIVFRILRDVGLAEDVVQLALLRTWQDLIQLRDPARLDDESVIPIWLDGDGAYEGLGTLLIQHVRLHPNGGWYFDFEGWIVPGRAAGASARRWKRRSSRRHIPSRGSIRPSRISEAWTAVW